MGVRPLPAGACMRGIDCGWGYSEGSKPVFFLLSLRFVCFVLFCFVLFLFALLTPVRAVALSPHYNASAEASYFEQCFDNLGELGKGSFGVVYKARSRDTGHIFAVKKSTKRYRGERDRLRRLTEAKTAGTLGDNPHCLHYYGGWEEKCASLSRVFLYVGGVFFLFFLLTDCRPQRRVVPTDGVLPERQPQRLRIQRQRCPGGACLGFSRRRRAGSGVIFLFFFLLKKTHGLFRRVQGLQAIHDRHLLHLDIKPANLFLDEHMNLKIGDFGIASSV
jgi:serine/threonine protein kinase